MYQEGRLLALPICRGHYLYQTSWETFHRIFIQFCQENRTWRYWLAILYDRLRRKTNDISGQKGICAFNSCWHYALQPRLQNQNSFCICAAFQTRNKQFALLSSIRSSELEAKERWPIGACSLRCPVWTSVLLQERAKQNPWTPLLTK